MGPLPSPVEPPSTVEALVWCLACHPLGAWSGLAVFCGGRSRGAGRLCPEVLRVRLLPGLAAGCAVGSAAAAVGGGFVHVPSVVTEDYCHGVGRSWRCPWGRLHSLVMPFCAGRSLSLVFSRARSRS